MLKNVRNNNALRLLLGEYRCLELLDSLEDIYVVVGDPLCPFVLIITPIKPMCTYIPLLLPPLAVLLIIIVSLTPPAVTYYYV